MILYSFFCIHVFFCNIKIKIKKGEDFEKFQKIVEEYIKDENNQKIVLKYWKTYIGFARREKDENIQKLAEDYGIKGTSGIRFAQALINAFRMLFIIYIYYLFSHIRTLYTNK